MLNIFYNPIYIKKKKVFITKHLKYSKLINLIINFCYFFNIPIHENLIESGPHKRMNNLIKSFKTDQDVNFNSIKYSNNYVVQYDDFGKSIVKKIIDSNDPNKKLIIGPLYNIEQDIEINLLTQKYNYIHKLVASEIAFKNAEEMDNNIDLEKVLICPSGMISKKEALQNLEIINREEKCLIYFKKRPRKDLNILLDFLDQKNQQYELFEYGNYKNKKLKEFSKKCRFGIIMGGTETQGFGIQEIMACNLPLLVWDQDTNFYDHLQISGTTVTVWDEHCGELVNNFTQLEKKYDYFVANLKNYNPGKLVLKKLTFEKFNSNLKELFHS